MVNPMGPDQGQVLRRRKHSVSTRKTKQHDRTQVDYAAGSTRWRRGRRNEDELDTEAVMHESSKRVLSPVRQHEEKQQEPEDQVSTEPHVEIHRRKLSVNQLFAQQQAYELRNSNLKCSVSLVVSDHDGNEVETEFSVVPDRPGPNGRIRVKHLLTLPLEISSTGAHVAARCIYHDAQDDSRQSFELHGYIQSVTDELSTTVSIGSMSRAVLQLNMTRESLESSWSLENVSLELGLTSSRPTTPATTQTRRTTDDDEEDEYLDDDYEDYMSMHTHTPLMMPQHSSNGYQMYPMMYGGGSSVDTRFFGHGMQHPSMTFHHQPHTGAALSIPPHLQHLGFAAQSHQIPVVPIMYDVYLSQQGMVPGNSMAMVPERDPHIARVMSYVDVYKGLLYMLLMESCENEWLYLCLREELAAVSQNKGIVLEEEGSPFVTWLIETLSGALSVLMCNKQTSSLIIDLVFAANTNQQTRMLELLDGSLQSLFRHPGGNMALKLIAPHLQVTVLRQLIRHCLAHEPFGILGNARGCELLGHLMRLLDDGGDTLAAALVDHVLDESNIHGLLTNRNFSALIIELLDLQFEKSEEKQPLIVSTLAKLVGKSDGLLSMICYHPIGLASTIALIRCISQPSDFDQAVKKLNVVELACHIVGAQIVKALIQNKFMHNMVADLLFDRVGDEGVYPSVELLSICADESSAKLVIEALELDNRKKLTRKRFAALENYLKAATNCASLSNSELQSRP